MLVAYYVCYIYWALYKAKILCWWVYHILADDQIDTLSGADNTAPRSKVACWMGFFPYLKSRRTISARIIMERYVFETELRLYRRVLLDLNSRRFNWPVRCSRTKWWWGLERRMQHLNNAGYTRLDRWRIERESK